MTARAATALTIEDLRTQARRRLPRMVFDFVDGGAEDEVTLRENRRAFADVAFRARVLVDVRERPQAVRVLGQDLAMPVILGPTGLARMVDPAGESAAAVAAHRAGTVSVVSSGSSVSLEDVAAAAPPQWFQLYPWGDRTTAEGLIERARSCGYRVMVVTVDVPVVGARERDVRNGLTVPPRVDLRTAWDVLRHPRWAARLVSAPKVTFANFHAMTPQRRGTSGLGALMQGWLNPGHTWADLAWMAAAWPGPILLKGVLTAEDARRAVDAGCAGVVVSNHGGRQADCLPGALDVLEEVVDAVGDQVDVLLDGGIRRGSDVVKALALGARACMAGRPWLYGLAADGLAGVEQVVRILHDEIDRTLALIGRPGVQALDRSAICLRPARGWVPADRSRVRDPSL